jgi:hypothetical protein
MVGFSALASLKLTERLTLPPGPVATSETCITRAFPVVLALTVSTVLTLPLAQATVRTVCPVSRQSVAWATLALSTTVPPDAGRWLGKAVKPVIVGAPEVDFGALGAGFALALARRNCVTSMTGTVLLPPSCVV